MGIHAQYPLGNQKKLYDTEESKSTQGSTSGLAQDPATSPIPNNVELPI